jgi:serine/threonine protein kinase
VQDFGHEQSTGTLFLVMDYAPHGSLRDRHPKGSTVPLPTVVSYVTQVADALQHAHDAKLIHRDVKPENMLLGYQNEVLLSDFGLVEVAHRTASLKTLGDAGTIEYMAPEQINGRPRTASDQYALAITVYEWLCGCRPFEGSLAIEIAMKHVTQPPPPLREKLPTLSAEVEQVVLKALANDPQERFGSVREFATALEEAGKKPRISMIGGKTKEQWFNEGYAHDQAKRYQEAIVAFSHVIELDPNDADSYYYRGLAYLKLKQYEQALADFDSTIALDSNNAIAYSNRGSAYTDLKQHQQAIADFDRAIALDPNNAIAYNNRGYAYQCLKQYQRALQDYDRALALNPNYSRARNNREEVLQLLREGKSR